MAEEFKLSAKIEAESSGFIEGIDASKEALGELGINVDAITKLLSGPVGLAAAFAVVAEKGMEAAREFDEAGAQLGKTTGETGAALDSLKTSLSNVVAGGVVQDVADVGNGMAELHVRLGLVGDDLENATKLFSDFADVTGQPVAQAVGDVTKLMAQWKIPADEVEITLDQLTKTAQLTGESAGQLTQVMASAGPIFQAANIPFSQGLGLMVGFQKAGIDASTATQGINIALRAFAKEGVADSGAALKDLIEKIKESGSQSEAQSIAVGNFGRAGIAMAQAIRGGSFDVDNWTKAIQNAGGTLKTTSDATDSFNDVATKLGNQVQGLLAEAFNNVLIFLKPFLSVLSDGIKLFESLPGPVKQTIEVFGILVGALKVAQVAMTLFGVAADAAMGPIGLILAAATALTVGIIGLASETANYNKKVQDQIDLVRSNTEEVNKLFDSQSGLQKEQAVSADTVAKLIQLYPELNGKIQANITTNEQAEKAARAAALAQAISGQNEAIQKQSDLRRSIDDTTNSLKERTKRLQDDAAGFGYSAQQIQKQLDSDPLIQQYSQRIKTLAEQMNVAKNAQQQFKDTINDLSGTAVKAFAKDIPDSTQKASQDMIDLNKAIALVNQAVANGTLSEEDGLKRKIQLRQNVIDKINQTADVTDKAYASEIANAQNLISLNKENEKSLDGITEAKKLQQTQDERNLAAATSQATIQNQAFEDYRTGAIQNAALDKKNFDDAEKHIQDLDDLQKRFTQNEIQNKIDALNKQRAADLAYANSIEANDKTIAAINKSYDEKIEAQHQASIDKQVQMWKDYASQILGTMNQLFGAIQGLVSAISDKQLTELDKQEAKAEEAAGVKEKTAVQSAQTALDAAKKQLQEETDANKLAADQQAVDDAQSALKRAQIEDEYNKKKAQAAYQAAHTIWGLQLAQTIASSALAVMNALAAFPGPPWTIPASIAAGVLGGIQIAAVAVAEPSPPGFQSGTPFSPEGMARIAENGPELVIGPSMANLAKGSSVLTAAETAQAMKGGSNVTVNISEPMNASIGQIRAELEALSRKLAFQGVL